MKITFTGTRHGVSHPQESQWVKLLWEWQVSELHVGVNGKADRQAVDIARRCGRPIHIIGHPPNFPGWRADAWDVDEMREPKPPIARNRDMVDESEKVAACPDGPERLRSGTWATVRYARKLDRDVRILNRTWP